MSENRQTFLPYPSYCGRKVTRKYLPKYFWSLSPYLEYELYLENLYLPKEFVVVARKGIEEKASKLGGVQTLDFRYEFYT